MVRRLVFLVLAAAIMLGSVNLYGAVAECYGVQQCNYYDEVKPNYDGSSGSWYCGWYGLGCTECVNSDCETCYVYGNAQCVRGN